MTMSFLSTTRSFPLKLATAAASTSVSGVRAPEPCEGRRWRYCASTRTHPKARKSAMAMAAGRTQCFEVARAVQHAMARNNVLDHGFMATNIPAERTDDHDKCK